MLAPLRLFLLLIWLTGIPDSAWGQSISTSPPFTSEKQSLLAQTSVSYFLDHSLKISTPHELEQQSFQRVPTDFKFNADQAAYWLKFELTNANDQPLTQWLDVNVFDSLKLLVVTDTALQTFAAGLLIDYAPEQYRSFRSIWRNKYGFLLSIAPHSSNTYYLRIRNVVRAETTLKSIVLSPLPERVETNGKRLLYFMLFSGAFFSIIVFLLLFSFIQYLQNRDPSYGLYALYLFFSGLYYWWKFEKSNSFLNFVFTRFPDWYYYFEVPLWVSMFSTYMLFVMYFIDTKKDIPFFYRFLKTALYGMLCYLIFDRIVVAIWGLSAAWDYFAVMRTAMTFVSITMIYLVFKTPKKLGTFVLWGSLFMIISGFITLFLSATMTQHYWGAWDIPLIPIQIGVIIEVGFFFLGLGAKSKLIEREKTVIYQNLQQQEKEAEQLKMQKNFLNRWYTNISHEFRTPLTVIEGMANNIRGNVDAKQLILNNSHQLLRLVNQMLDLAKLETNTLRINWVQGDVVRFLRYLVSSFQSYAHLQQLTLSFHSHEEGVLMDYDAEKLECIIINLLQNAIKHTPIYGDIKLIAQVVDYQNNKALLLKLSDTGEGIPATDLPHIFDRFHQSEQHKNTGGSGIGLALIKELVGLLGGSIEVESELATGSCFSIYLPIHNQAAVAEQLQPLQLIPTVPPSSKKTEPLSIEKNTNQRPLLLIVEDNHDVAHYLQSLLHKDYQLLFATNGAIGIQLAIEQIPDIIISDVMMPEKDGFELTEELKTDCRTSHIPIILLTAKATMEDRIAGLSVGADVYLAKPFHQEELRVRLQQLLATQQRMQAHYQDVSQPVSTTPTSENLFIQQLNETIKTHLTDSNFGIQPLCQLMAMSKTQLYRKVKALTGKSVGLYIRSHRLQYATQLLQTTDLPIGQVATHIGVQDVSYFSRIYRQEYGCSPSEIRSE